MKTKCYFLLLLSFFMTGLLRAADGDSVAIHTVANSSKVEVLSDEIWLKIFLTELTAEDIGTLRQVCKRFSLIGKDAEVMKKLGGFTLQGIPRFPREIMCTPHLLTAALATPEIVGNYKFVSELINNLLRSSQKQLLTVVDNHDRIEMTLLEEQERMLKKRIGEEGGPHFVSVFLGYSILSENTWDAARNAAWNAAWRAAWRAVEEHLSSIKQKLHEKSPETYKLTSLITLLWMLTPKAQETFELAYRAAYPLIPEDFVLENARTIIATTTWDNPALANNPYIQMMKRVWGEPAIVEIQ